MELKDLKDHIESFPEGTIFQFGISEPFSWRGSYSEVAFSIVEQPSSREEILKNIQTAYTETFRGYKGGEYRYSDWTPVNFESGGYGNYSDGNYTASMIAKLEKNMLFKSQEHRLAVLAFSISKNI